MFFYPTYWFSCERAHKMVGSDKKKKDFSPSWSAQNYGAIFFSNCTNFFRNMKTIFDIYFWAEWEFPKCQKNLSTGRFFRVPNFFGQKLKRSTFITFPSRLKFPKLPKFIWSILEKKISWIFPSIEFVEFPNFWAKMEKFRPI